MDYRDAFVIVLWQKKRVVAVNQLRDIAQNNRRLIIWGIVLMVIGLQAPSIIRLEYSGIMESILYSIDTGNINSLLMAAIRLVVMNTIRALPIYMGALLFAEGVGAFQSGGAWWIRWFIIFLIPCIYEGIYYLHGVTYDFGVPAITMTLVVLIVSKMKNLNRSIAYKCTVVILLLFGVEWLDIVPILSPYHFGRGSLSDLIKTTSYLNHANEIFNLLGISVCIICVVNAVLLAHLLNLYTVEVHDMEQNLELEKLNHQMTMQIMENRSLREIKALVHDLKTPLTSIQGLAGVISISGDNDMAKKYANYISSLVDKMSTMVNELLNDDSQQTIRVEELVRYAMAHVPQLNSIGTFELNVKANPAVRVNKIRLSRAIINILQNALEAIDQETGYIKLTVEEGHGNVILTVIDNGKGFVGDVENIWKVGFSSKNSTGLGMPYVLEVVEKYGGTVKAGNRLDGGARFVITLPEVNGYE
ncbi:hypothetical protein SDC9_22210 [bioreactor metagenome]|uniref:histidine kinase n=1 Tax=bioreactor metagenome TaxID=1076179 RepID=A0A644UBI5_9ZZZZ